MHRKYTKRKNGARPLIVECRIHPHLIKYCTAHQRYWCPGCTKPWPAGSQCCPGWSYDGIKLPLSEPKRHVTMNRTRAARVQDPDLTRVR